MASPGYYENPSHKRCFSACRACYRCEDKGKWAKCAGCSGRHDPTGMIDPCEDDFCDCRNGVLRWRTEDGRVFIRRYNRNPFGGRIQQVQETEDERDWKAYLQEYRERFDNPYISPITIDVNGKRGYYDSNYVGFYDEDGNKIEDV